MPPLTELVTTLIALGSNNSRCGERRARPNVKLRGPMTLLANRATSEIHLVWIDDPVELRSPSYHDRGSKCILSFPVRHSRRSCFHCCPVHSRCRHYKSADHSHHMGCIERSFSKFLSIDCCNCFSASGGAPNGRDQPRCWHYQSAAVLPVALG